MFSVIIPVHNVEEYLEKCVNSILSQNECELEVLLIENGSTDSSPDICRRLADSDNRVKLIVAEEKGVSNARNLGIKASSGDWIVFVDSDDYVLSGCFSLFEKEISSGADTDLIVGNYTQSDTPEKLSGKRAVITAEAYGKAMLDTPKYFSEMNSSLTWKPGILGVNWGKAFKGSVIRDNQLFFDTDITIFEDLLFNLKYLNHITSVSCIDVPVYYYRVAEGSLSRTTSDKRIVQRIDYLKHLYRTKVHKSLIEAKKFHIGQNILRTYVVSARCISNSGSLRKELQKFIERESIQRIIQGLRYDDLSNGKIQNRFFALLLFLLKRRLYHTAFWVCWIYAKFKHKN